MGRCGPAAYEENAENAMINDTYRSTAEGKVAELLQLLDQAQANAAPYASPEQATPKATDVEPSFQVSDQPPVAPRRAGPATWMMESPEVDHELALRSFSTLHPACRGEVLEQFRSLRTRVFLERKALVRPQLRKPRLLQRHLVIAIEVVDAHHAVATRQQRLRDVITDESRGAG